jgi:hypothetical protein
VPEVLAIVVAVPDAAAVTPVEQLDVAEQRPEQGT